MAKLVICDSCGAQFSNEEPKCPYCGTMNYEGAEKEYFEKLEDIREDVEKLSEVPLKETKAELKKQGRFIKKIVLAVCVLAIVVAVISFWREKSYERDNKADFIWQQTNFPTLDELYEEGKYDELAAFYRQAEEEDKPVYMWEHAEFVRAYDYVQDYYADLDYMKSQDASEEKEVWLYGLYFWTQWKVLGYQFSGDLTEEEKAYFAETFVEVEKSLRNDWGMDDATYQEFYAKLIEPYGSTVTFDECDAYIQKWKKESE